VDIELFAGRFDDPTYPVDTGAFGSPSDLDGNDRVIILFTPSVNRLTPPRSKDLIGGLFFCLDLLPELEHSNADEVFYVLVPDPTGTYGNVRNVDVVRSTVPPILAHEFQHMIHHNERIIKREASTRESIWLSEDWPTWRKTSWERSLEGVGGWLRWTNTREETETVRPCFSPSPPP
jgi:hypothetical protein